jgi:hypothetical protein
MVLVAIGEVAAPRIADGHRDGTGDDGPRCRQSPTNTTLGDIGVVARTVACDSRRFRLRPQSLVAAAALNDQQKCPRLTHLAHPHAREGGDAPGGASKKEKQGGCQAIALYTFSTKSPIPKDIYASAMDCEGTL